MSREIKFRCWEQMSSLWIKPNEIAIQGDGILLLYNNEYFDSSDDWEPVLMQYTGLKDKNGVEIYEGDIVRGIKQYYDDVISKVYWDDDSAGFSPFYDNYEVDFATDRDEFEIIGNIYENSELLKGGNLMSNCCSAQVSDPSGEGIEGRCMDCGEMCSIITEGEEVVWYRD